MPLSPHTPAPFEMAIDIQWRRPGAIRLDGQRLVFPEVPAEPGVYRIRYEDAHGRQFIYIGESTNMIRRAASYARGTSASARRRRAAAGKSLSANRALHDRLVRALRNKGTAQYQVCKNPRLVIGGRGHSLDMSRTFQRRLVEDAALVYSQVRGRAAIYNADRLQAADTNSAA